jgi:hypothetical protein
MPFERKAIRFRVDPRDVPRAKAARRLGLTEAEFASLESRLNQRGFPEPDPDTGLYDMKAIEAWMDVRSALTVAGAAPQSRSLLQKRLEAWDGGAAETNRSRER